MTILLVEGLTLMLMAADWSEWWLLKAGVAARSGCSSLIIGPWTWLAGRTPAGPQGWDKFFDLRGDIVFVPDGGSSGACGRSAHLSFRGRWCTQLPLTSTLGLMWAFHAFWSWTFVHCWLPFLTGILRGHSNTPVENQSERSSEPSLIHSDGDVTGMPGLLPGVFCSQWARESLLS